MNSYGKNDNNPEYIPLPEDENEKNNSTKYKPTDEPEYLPLEELSDAPEVENPQPEDPGEDPTIKKSIILPFMTERLSVVAWIIIISLFCLIILLLFKVSITRYSQFTNIGGPGLGIFYLVCFVIFFVSIGYVIFKAIRDYIRVDDGSELALIAAELSENSDTDVILDYAAKIADQYEEHPLESVRHGVKELRQRMRKTVEHEDMLGEVKLGILANIDQEVEKIISKTAKETFLGTAISPIPAVDIGIVAWRSIIMVRDIATLYGYRPGFLGSLRLLSRILSTIAFAGISDIIADATSNLIGNAVLNRLSANLAHAFGTSLLTARLGIAACINCRPYPLQKDELKGYIKLLFRGLRSILSAKVSGQEES